MASALRDRLVYTSKRWEGISLVCLNVTRSVNGRAKGELMIGASLITLWFLVTYGQGTQQPVCGDVEAVGICEVLKSTIHQLIPSSCFLGDLLATWKCEDFI